MPTTYTDTLNVGRCGKCCTKCKDAKSTVNCCINNTDCPISQCKKLDDMIRNCSLCEDLRDCSKLKAKEISPVETLKTLSPWTIIDDIFNYDSHQITEYCGLEIKNAFTNIAIRDEDFFSDLYVPHADETSFSSCVSIATRPLILISGPVGSGKSTFLKKVILKRSPDDRPLSYIYVSFSQYSYKQHDFSPDNDLGYFNYVIKNAILSQFTARYNLKKLPDTILNKLDVFADIELTSRVKRYLLYEASMLRAEGGNALKKKIIEDFSSQCRDLSKDAYYRVVTEIPDYELDDLFNSYLDVFCALIVHSMESEAASQVIIFDNIEELNLERMGGNIIDYFDQMKQRYESILSMHNTLRQYRKNLMLTIAVRTPNIERINTTNLNVLKTSVITLDEHPHIMHRFQHVRYIYSRNNQKNDRRNQLNDFIANVISARIRFLDSILLESNCENRFYPLFKEVMQVIVDKFKSTDNVVISGIDIVSLCNCSIRLFLQMISSTISGYVKNSLRSSADPKFERPLLESFIWKHIWSGPSSPLIEDTGKELLVGSTSECPPLCLERMILSMLYNKASTGVTLRDIQSAVQTVFGKSCVDSVRPAILKLTDGASTQSNLAYVVQEKRVENNHQISEESKIFIDQRGIIFIEKMLINIDYLNYMISRQGDETIPFVQKDICEVQDFVQRASIVFSSISKDCTEHYQKLLDDTTKNAAISLVYKENFMIRQRFYIERLITSVMSSIKFHVMQLLLGPDYKTLESIAQPYSIGINYVNAFNPELCICATDERMHARDNDFIDLLDSVNDPKDVKLKNMCISIKENYQTMQSLCTYWNNNSATFLK